MKKYEEYDEAEAFTGEYERLEPGGYVCKILQVKCEEKPYGHLLRIGFDIEEGEHEGFYKRQFDRRKEKAPDTKWPGMYYQTVNPEYMGYFKGFMLAIENSNPGFEWNWDEKTLKDKLFGGVFGEEEYLGNDGGIKTSVKCMYITTIDNIMNGNFKVPDIKRLDTRSSDSGSKYSDSTYYNLSEDDDELPF
ncbi:MAG: hypothetical protein M0R06_09360 [Sphaerochaeta sp.]|jgi:hypothetical protein|nr:hypothetical protein [Sphaerochaeta sp.]